MRAHGMLVAGVGSLEWLFGLADRIVCATWEGVLGWAPGEGVALV